MSKVKEEGLKVNVEVARKWLATGAQPTDAVAKLLVAAGVEEVKSFIRTEFVKGEFYGMSRKDRKKILDDRVAAIKKKADERAKAAKAAAAK